MSQEEAKIVLESNGDDVSLEVTGTGMSLGYLIFLACQNSEDFKTVLRMGLEISDQYDSLKDVFGSEEEE